jgi:Carboxypeptidase regulatory-like domain/TonB-dependent Receptor Plug Domain
MYKIFLAFILGLAISTLGVALPQAAKLKGVVAGLQADGNKIPLAGATVQLQGSAMLKNPETVTDSDGRFIFLDLPPGDYIITASVPGFEPYSASYKLLPGALGELDIDLKIATANDIVDVKATEAPINLTETTNKGELKAQILRNAPLVNERFQDALPLLPGVVRGPDGLLNIKGARSGQSGLLVNSTNVTDPVTGDFAISLPIEAIESVSVLSSPYSAEFGKFTGAVTAIGTRAGGDKYRFLFTNFFPRLRRRNDPITGESKIVGLESFTPRLILTGPIIKKKLTFSQSFEYRFIRTIVPSLPGLSNDTKLETFDSFTQVDYDINERNHLTFNLSFFPQNTAFNQLNTFNPMEVTSNFRQRGFFVSVTERSAMGNSGLLETTFAIKRFNAFIFPQGDQAMTIAPTVNSGNFFNRQDRFSDRYDFQSTYNLPVFRAIGDHAVKIGGVLSFNTYDGRDANMPIRVTRDSGQLRQLIDFTGDGLVARDNFEQTLFIQDKFTLRPNIIFDIGLRYDHNELGAGQNFAPRIGFLIIPFSGGRTVLRGGIGRFYDKVPLGVGTFLQLQNRRITQFDDDGQTISTQTLLRNTFANRIRTPYSVSGTFEVDQEIINKRLFFRFGFQRREGRDEFIIDPALDLGLLALSNGGRSRYREYQFTTRYRLDEGNEILFSYVRSRATGDLNDFNIFFGNFRNPIIRGNERRNQPFDAPNRFLITGTAKLPFDLTAAPVLDIRTGFPFSLTDENQNFVGPRNAQRFPRFIALDLQVTKGIKLPILGKKYGTRVGVKIFNLTNHFNPRDVQANIDSFNFGVFSNSINRTFRGKFEFDF